MKKFLFILPVFIALLSCQQKELFPCPPQGDIPVNVIIHWDNATRSALPSGMTTYWYPRYGGPMISDLGTYGGNVWLYSEIYNPMCLDFYGNKYLAFRSSGSHNDFEVYNVPARSKYNDFVQPLPEGENTVAEAQPYAFYVDSRPQTVDAVNLPYGDTLTVHFYPKNVLREFTFLIYNVTGAKNITASTGAISGMSGSYFPADSSLAATPSTILFDRVTPIVDGQHHSWTPMQKAYFEMKNPYWQSTDTTVGWTNDWITGKFSTFGALDRKANRFRLVVDAVSKAKNYYYGAWGYWGGRDEMSIAAQIDSAMGRNGTLAEQMAWRERNGGYDIVLNNRNRLAVPDEEAPSDGGFVVNVDDWGEMVYINLDNNISGSKSEISNLKSEISNPNSVKQRTPANTYATISDFTVNGWWKDGANGYSIFHEQYVYKTESRFWKYQPVKYWELTGDITFYAYAPAGIKNMMRGLHNNGIDGSDPTVRYSMPAKDCECPPPGPGEPPIPKIVDNNQEDLLIAVQNRPCPPQHVQNDSVPMNFRHAFSRVGVRAKIDDAYHHYAIKVTRVDLRNVYTTAELTLAPNTVENPSTGIPMEYSQRFNYDGSTVLWKNHSDLASYNFKLVSTQVTLEDNFISLIRANDAVFVIPQTMNASNYTAVYVEYILYEVSATGELYKASYSKLIPVPNGFSFEIGRQYTLNLTLDVP